MRNWKRGLAALFVGALAAFAPATAAQATETKLTGKASDCAPAGWTATWTFTNKSVVKVSVDAARSSVDAALVPSKSMPVVLGNGESITFTSTVPVKQRSATLVVEFRHEGHRAGPWGLTETAREKITTCCKEDEPTIPPSGMPSEEPTTPPSGGPSNPPSQEPSEEPSSPGSSTPPPAGDDDEQPPADGSGGGTSSGEQLPLTGAPVAGAVGVGVLLLVAGGVALLAVRRRRRFEA